MAVSSRVVNTVSWTRIPPSLFAPRLLVQARMYHNQEIERTNHLAGTSDATKSTDGASDDKDSRSGAFSGINAASDNEPSSPRVQMRLSQIRKAKLPEVCSKRCWRCVT